MINGLQCIIGRFQTWPAIWKSSDVREPIQQSNDGLTSFFMLSVLEAKIFQHGFFQLTAVTIVTYM